MRTRSTRLAVAGLLTSVAAMAVSPAYAQAQDAAEPQAAEDEAASDGVIVVSGTRFTSRTSLQTKRDADIVMDVIASDELNALPDLNVAEAISRVPGATAFQDEGAGLYIGLRGLNQEFVNLTLEGLEISSAARTFDQNLRGANLEAVPGSFLSRVEVAKSATAEYDADAIAGTVNLVTASAVKSGKNWFVVKGNLGQYTTDVPTDDTDLSWKANVSFGQTFGSDDQFGIALSAHYTDRSRDNLKPKAFFGSQDDPNELPDEVGGFFYQRDEESWGASGKLEFQPNPDVYVFGSLLYFDSNVELDKSKHALFGARSFTDSGTFDRARGTIRNDKVNYGVDDSLTGQLGLDVQLNDHNHLSLRGSLSSSRSYQDDPRVDWASGRIGEGSYEYNGQYYTYTLTDESFADFINPASYGFGGYRRFQESFTKDVSGFRADWENRSPDELGFSFKVGGKFKETDVDYTASNFRWRNPVDTFDPTDFFGVFDYRFPFTNNPQLLVSDVLAIAARAEAAGEAGFGRISSVIVNGNDFFVNERVLAGYSQLRYTGENFDVIAGLRYEDTDIQARNRFNRQDDAPFVTTSQSYDNLLPSLTVNFKPNDNIVLRLGASQTLGRADIFDLARGETPPNDNGVFARGNPDLLPRKSTNLDASFEYYFDGGKSAFAVGVYRKDIKNEIYDLQTPYVFQSDLGPINSFFLQPTNAGKARVQGVELSFTKDNFDFLPGALRNFGFFGNVTFNDGYIRLIDDTGAVARVTDPEGFADFLANATLFYEGERLSGRVAYRYVAPQNQGLSIDGSADLVLDSYSQVDLHLGYQVADNVELTFDVWNLLENKQTFTNQNAVAGAPNWFETVEYGRAFWGGVSVKF
ncbi:TonB-dependent receptor [Erythrobacter aureus]|uniref:TonB-dependent receptor n=1 Tax=Erythrobacter aureus TaxID=2182384 RepID=A0A345YAZ9_9SPHN|nr:TonB-dependent receptor [Erythrobacter aureus]AXK41101.1 TonB-dependent receptor [Erythrobacter aureus]